MFRVTLKSLWSHKRRLFSTALAVLLGVAFMTGTLVLSGTLDKAFSDLFADANQGVDTVVQGKDLFTSGQGAGTLRAKIKTDTVEAVRAVDGVEGAEPYVLSLSGAILDDQGDALGGAGPPTIFQSWVDDSTLNSFRVSEGRAPAADGEAAINETAVEDGGYQLGDDVTLLTLDGREKFSLVGITRYGDSGSQAGVITIDMTVSEAQRVSGTKADEVDTLLVRGDGSLPDADLTDRVQLALPGEVFAVTGEESAQELADAVSSGFGFLSQLLLVFAGIALFVGTFIISNTFAILLAQRTRELALLRAIGASRSQVLGSVVLEALLIGVAAALIGLAAGVALAIGALGALRTFAGAELPGDTIVVSPSTIATALVVGLVVTTGSAILPAIRATRIPPIAALRNVSVDRSSRSWVRAVLGLVLLVGGLFLAAPAFGDDIKRSSLTPIALGAVGILLAVLAAGPLIAKPLSWLLGGWLPRFRGITGRLATQNARRNPARTASTSAALAIGITLVGFITIFAASTRAAVTTDVERGFRGDYIIQQPNSFGFGGVSPQLATDLAEVDGVAVATGFKQSETKIGLPDGTETGANVGAIDPDDYAQVFSIRMDTGSLADLDDGGVIVDREIADTKDLGIGDEVTVVFPGGDGAPFRVTAIGDDATLLGDWTITAADFTRLTVEPIDFLVAVKVADGTDADALRSKLRQEVDQYPTVALQDRDQFIGSLTATINQFLIIIIALLGLSVVIALIGIANTLSLSIHERTRELGLLRAVGMSRGQLRSTIRWEAIVVALIGTVLGLAMSVGLSWLVIKGLQGYGLGTYVVPWGQMAFVVLLGAGLGVLAALRPAHRAGKLNVLDAVGAE